MKILENINLAKYCSMGLGGNAKYFIEIKSKEDLIESLKFADFHKLKRIMIGGGNNIIFSDKTYDGLVMVNSIMGIKEKADNVFKVASGEDWDDFVRYSTNKNLSGIEALSMIPGKMGSAPYQNIGAYGQELAETVISVDAVVSETYKKVTIPATDCNFSYRSSIFKTHPNKYYICGITIKLRNEAMSPPFYESLQSFLDKNNIKDYSPTNIRKAVIAIRSEKLPDPKKVKNCGSFFINPIIEKEQFEEISRKYPDIPNWSVGPKVKVSAAWLLDRLGLKDYHHPNGMATWKNQSLVVVNEHAKKVSDLLEFRDFLSDKVYSEFNIKLTMEPVLID